AGFRIQRDQAIVDRADVHLPFPHGDTAVHDVAARVHGPLAGHLRIEKPDQFAAARVVGTHLAPRFGDVDDAIDDDGRRFLATVRVEVGEPREAKLVHVVLGDLRQWAEALFTIRAAVRQPVLAGVFLRDDAFLVYFGV